MSDYPPPNSTATPNAMPASHPSAAARLMLEHKAMEYRQVWPLLTFTGQHAARLSEPTDPRLARQLPALRRSGPEPQVFPTEPERRTAVQEAERWATRC